MTNDYRVDAWGRVIINPQAAFRLAHQGHDVWSMPMDPDPAVDVYNKFCVQFDHPDYRIDTPAEPTVSPEQEHQRRAQTWLVPEEYQSLDVRALLLSRCNTVAERERTIQEMDLFEARGLTPLLQLMVYLVDNFRANGVVWGVGRGSSVASYALFLIGVHKIDPIKYGLDITEFLKPEE